MCFIAGCNSVSSLTQKAAKPVALPEWVKSPPRDNAESFFGMGEGKKKEFGNQFIEFISASN
ncbi:MAG: hypothetical protein JKY84_05360 [Emcibacteraceae bacterium]|nr:hypothetical protein [Emcibacteraceae bacterium]